ncbi:MAG: agmatine deiminase family protein [Arenimonas sp.]|nr:agmatine deiminase family protein [Arenimonas sp.]
MITKRDFLKAAILLGSSTMVVRMQALAAPTSLSSSIYKMPDESEPHIRTWMAFGASKKIWGSKLLSEVQRNLASIANTIVEFEPVNMLVREADLAIAKKLVNSKVKLIVFPLDDIWARDTGSVFVFDDMGRKAAIDFNFNGWGNKQAHAQDTQVAQFMAEAAGVPRVSPRLVLEGGALEVDGQGTGLMTESCILNDNRNPGLSKASVEATLKPLLGLDKIIWLPGVKGKDITDAHIDFYARFVRPGVVVAGYEPDNSFDDHEITKTNIALLKNANDAQGRKLVVHVLTGPASIRDKYASDDFAAGYLNYYLCNGAVIATEFGDKKADDEAKRILEKLYPDRKVIQLNIDGIAAGGGGIHCVTQQEPA